MVNNLKLWSFNIKVNSSNNTKPTFLLDPQLLLLESDYLLCNESKQIKSWVKLQTFSEKNLCFMTNYL